MSTNSPAFGQHMRGAGPVRHQPPSSTRPFCGLGREMDLVLHRARHRKEGMRGGKKGRGGDGDDEPEPSESSYPLFLTGHTCTAPCTHVICCLCDSYKAPGLSWPTHQLPISGITMSQGMHTSAGQGMHTVVLLSLFLALFLVLLLTWHGAIC